MARRRLAFAAEPRRPGVPAKISAGPRADVWLTTSEQNAADPPRGPNDTGRTWNSHVIVAWFRWQQARREWAAQHGIHRHELARLVPNRAGTLGDNYRRASRR
jgi:hypothetical protein